MSWDPVSAGESRYPKGPRGQGGKQGRNAVGPKAVPPGVKAGIRAMVLSGDMKQAAIAASFGVSRDLVARLAQTARDVDRDQVAAITRGLPGLLKVATAGFAVKTIEALERDDITTATKAMFGAKLGTEGTRWAQPASENSSETLLQYIQALQVNVTVNPAAAPSDADEVVDASP